MARYGQAFKDRAEARLLPPESAALEVVVREVGIGAGILDRWREDVRLEDRGRDAHCWAPPAQIRTCGIPAYGSYRE